MAAVDRHHSLANAVQTCPVFSASERTGQLASSPASQRPPSIRSRDFRLEKFSNRDGNLIFRPERKHGSAGWELIVPHISDDNRPGRVFKEISRGGAGRGRWNVHVVGCTTHWWSTSLVCSEQNASALIEWPNDYWNRCRRRKLNEYAPRCWHTMRGGRDSWLFIHVYVEHQTQTLPVLSSRDRFEGRWLTRWISTAVYAEIIWMQHDSV